MHEERLACPTSAHGWRREEVVEVESRRRGQGPRETTHVRDPAQAPFFVDRDEAVRLVGLITQPRPDDVQFRLVGGDPVELPIAAIQLTPGRLVQRSHGAHVPVSHAVSLHPPRPRMEVGRI